MRVYSLLFQKKNFASLVFFPYDTLQNWSSLYCCYDEEPVEDTERSQVMIPGAILVAVCIVKTIF